MKRLIRYLFTIAFGSVPMTAERRRLLIARDQEQRYEQYPELS